MLSLRRIPGLLYIHRHSLYMVTVLFTTLVYFLFRWNLVCSNVQSWQHIKRMCSTFTNGAAVGSLCSPLCSGNDIGALTCHSFRSTKEAVFSAEWHDIRLVFKAATNVDGFLHWHDNGLLTYPSESDFTAIVRHIVKNMTNQWIPRDTAAKLSRLKPMFEEADPGKRHREMDDLFVLLQDNEYLLSALHADRDVFPQLIGTCGRYFAVEFVEPIVGVSVLSVNDDKSEWSRRLKVSLLVMELLEELEAGFAEPFHLCDVKLEHFGLARGGSKVKFIDLLGVYAKSVVSSAIGSKACSRDEDCELYDCRGRCHVEKKRCASSVTNSNLQVVCEKIFLGWRMSNTILIPGLLMSQHTPSELASVLRQCANPDMEGGKPRTAPGDELRKRLYNILIEIDQSLNDEIILR